MSDRQFESSVSTARCRPGKAILTAAVLLLMVLYTAAAAAAQENLSLTQAETQWLAAHPKLRLGVGVAFPPFMWVDKENGRHQFKGIVSDYVALLSTRLGVETEIVFDIPFDRALELGKKKEIDLFPCLSKTPDRSEFLRFTKPYLVYPLVIITRDDAPIIGGIESLAQKRFATVKHLVVYSKLINAYPDLDLDFVFTDRVAENLDAVSLNRADACIINLAVATYYIHRKGYTNLRIAAPVKWDDVQLSMGIRSDWPILQGILDKTLASLSQDEKDRISQRWIRIDWDAGIDKMLVLKWIGGVGVCVAILFFYIFTWNRRLKKEIVEKERAEKALIENERRLSTLIGNLPGIAYQCINDTDWTMRFISDGCKHLTGYDADELIENKVTSYNDLILQADRQQVWDAVQASIAQNLTFAVEYRIRDRSGKIKWVWEKGVCLFHERQNVQLLEGFIADITERKNAEQALQENEVRYQSAQRMGRVGNWEYDLVTETFWGSDQAKKIYGLDPDSERFTTDAIENCIPERERVHQALIDLIERDTPYDLEFDIHPISGPETRTVRSLAEITRDASGAAQKVIGVIQDISEQKRSLKEKDKLEKALSQAQKMESIGNLAGGIAHDFNNILSSILGFSELAIEDAPKGSSVEASLQEVYSAGKRAKDLVKQILAFARQSDEKKGPLQPSAVVSEVLKFIRSTIPTTITIKQEITSDAYVMGNATQVHQVLMNLCTNAAHAMEDTGGVLSVTLKDRFLEKADVLVGMRPGDYVEITVTDTGVGIASELIKSVFDPYFTTKATGEGSGMGLAVVHGIVESYGGKIGIDSQLGRGTTMTVYLPVTVKRGAPPAYESTQMPAGTEHILFVDDEASIANLGSQMLERLGYTVTTRTSSIEALGLFQANPDGFDLVVTDMTMPNLTGDKLAIELMKIRPEIPIILCTGYSNKMSAEAAAEIGIKAFAYKPVVMADLAVTVRNVLDAVG